PRDAHRSGDDQSPAVSQALRCRRAGCDCRRPRYRGAWNTPPREPGLRRLYSSPAGSPLRPDKQRGHGKAIRHSMNRIALMRILSRVRLPAPMALWKYYHRKLFGLHRRLLGIRTPLPPFTDYSVTADFANLMISEILEHKPSLIVEAGSGLSTIIAAYCLKQLGRGFLIALEHEPRYLELCQHAILDPRLPEYVR